MNQSAYNIDKYKFLKENSDLIPKLPEMEKTIVDLFFHDVKQKDIGKILGITQGAVASRISKLMSRLAYLKELKGIDFNIFFQDIEKICTPLELEIIKVILETSCQTQTAWVINGKLGLKGPKKLNQIKVRHKFESVMELLKEIGEHSNRYRRHYKTLQKIKENLYVLHEVKLPHFDRKAV